MNLFLDSETYNDQVDIRAGTYRYAETCELDLLSYKTDGDHLIGNKASVWDATAEPMPADLRNYLDDPDVILIAHNAQFDRLVLHYTIGLPLDPTRWRCSMARALAHSLPGALGMLAPILGVKQRQEDKAEGRKLMHKFCKPQGKDKERRTRHTNPKDWARYIEYNRDDTDDLVEVWYKLPEWNYRGEELALWHLDQQINDRGIYVDIDLCHAAVLATKRAKKSLAKRVQAATGGEVEKATQRDKLLAFLLDVYGVDLPDMTKATLERRLNDPDLPDPVRELIAIRLQATKTSTSKYTAFVKASNADGRVRGMLAFCGALRTGRWSGRVVQLQNLPRPNYKQSEIDLGVDAMKHDVADLIFPDVMSIASSAIRGALVAPDGKKLVVSDLANIEGRKLAWLAGEEWKLQAFRDYDTILSYDAEGKPIRKGHDLYKLAYSRSFGVPVESVEGDRRQIGKVQELALGYQGAEGAFVAMGAVYGVDIVDAFPSVWEAASEEHRKEAEGFYKWAYKKYVGVARTLSREAFLAACIIKMGWREANANIVSFWPELAQTAVLAIRNPGVTFDCRLLKVKRAGHWLLIRLPSGRLLCYPSAQVDDKGKLSYMGVHQYTHRWQRIKTYGGKLAENVTQASARDCLREGMFRAEEQGYNVVLTVHDELITETPDSDDFNVEGLSELLARNTTWNQGLPMTANGFETYRYRKG